MLRSASLVFAMFLVSKAALAQNQVGPHSSQDDDACRGDAHRFCKDAIPDQFRVLSCLQTNRPRLSRACKVVLQSHGM
jgi:Cysteine rich repeat